MLTLFWCDFLVCLGLYAYVCLADNRYREVRPCSEDYEPRQCEDCHDVITRRRVKHCQTCAMCTVDFDHHCRYLNVCIGGRTYKPWVGFVATLLGLMCLCSHAAVDALVDESPARFPLGFRSLPAFYTLLGIQAVLSLLESTFLLCLLSQHVYFVVQGITTLEYIKDQSPGFPSLPPRGWRDNVLRGECYRCSDELEVTEVEDPAEVWYCTICQSDLAKSGIEFLSCDSCDNVNVCPVCRRAAQRDDLVVTHRASTLRRRSSEIGGLSGAADVPRGVSFRSGRSEARHSRRSLGAVLAEVEGHPGDAKVFGLVTCCDPPEGGDDFGEGEDSDGSSDGTADSPYSDRSRRSPASCA